MIDLVAIRASLRRLDAIAAAHPDLVGACGPDNLHGWEQALADDEDPPMANTKMVGFRFSDELKDRLEQYRQRLESQTPGVEFSMADTVRVLLTKALDAEQIPPPQKG